jgi:hypothetical protein
MDSPHTRGPDVQSASDILGVPVPSDAPSFLLALGAHVAAGLTAVIAGAVAAFASKTGRVHPRAGLVYWWALTWIFISSIMMAILRWPYDIHLVAIGSIAFVTGTSGALTRWLHRPAGHGVHIVSMGVSYVAVLTGFYVDNGPHLPGWSLLPRWMFWVLPAVVGIPLIARSLRRWTMHSSN